MRMTLVITFGGLDVPSFPSSLIRGFWGGVHAFGLTACVHSVWLL